MNRVPSRRFMPRILSFALAATLLAGCSGPDLDGGVAAGLQQRVATAKKHAAQQDFTSALAELDRLGQEVTTAAGRGQLSESRKARIEAAIGSIRSALEAAAPAPQPAATSPAPLTEEQQEQLEEAQKEAEEQREKAQKEAEDQRKKAQEEAEKLREEAQKEAEKQRGNG